jgi:plasmid stabilization system protein ParE
MDVFLLPQAIEDLDVIEDPLFTEVIKKIYLLKSFPDIGAPMDGPFSGFRSLLVVRLFRVVYRIHSPGRIDIAYIRHTRRRLF